MDARLLATLHQQFEELITKDPGVFQAIAMRDRGELSEIDALKTAVLALHVRATIAEGKVLKHLQEAT